MSGEVDEFPSLHVVPFGWLPYEHVPVPGLQMPAVWHWPGAAQTTGVPATQPEAGLQVSTPLQALPSLQTSGVPATQPEAGLQVSTPLQALPSLQTGGVPATQPEAGLQVSTPLQALPSLQESGVPATQPEAGLQVSAPLQTLPSSQVIGAFTQPVAGLQESAVQAFPSSQCRERRRRTHRLRRRSPAYRLFRYRGSRHRTGFPGNELAVGARTVVRLVGEIVRAVVAVIADRHADAVPCAVAGVVARAIQPVDAARLPQVPAGRRRVRWPDRTRSMVQSLKSSH